MTLHILGIIPGINVHACGFVFSVENAHRIFRFTSLLYYCAMSSVPCYVPVILCECINVHVLTYNLRSLALSIFLVSNYYRTFPGHPTSLCQKFPPYPDFPFLRLQNSYLVNQSFAGHFWRLFPVTLSESLLPLSSKCFFLWHLPLFTFETEFYFVDLGFLKLAW